MVGKWEILVVITLIFTVSFTGAYAVKETETPEVMVIFQFANGRSISANVLLPTDNHTAIKATELACLELNLYLNYTWSTYGAFVNQIGWEKNDFSGTGYWWHLMVWENDSYSWEPSQVGVSSLILEDGDVIAWVYTVDDSNWHPYTPAYVQPGHYNVWVTPRGDFNNTGSIETNLYGKDVVWKFRGGSSWGFSSTPVAGNGMIFIADSAGIYALNMHGTLLWNSSKGAAGGYGIASPVLFGDYVIIGTADEHIRAFYFNNGTVAWEFSLGADVTSAPVVGFVNKYPAVFAVTFSMNSPGKIYAVNLTSWEEMWNLTLLGSNYFGIPAIADGKIYVPVAGIEDNSYTWNPPYAIQCIDVRGHYLWNFTLNSSIRSSPVVVDNTLYFVTTGGYLNAMNLSTQALRWSYYIGKSTVSPAVNGNTLYVANDNGDVYGIRDDGDHAELLWKKKVNGSVKASPLYAGGKVVFVTDTSSSTVYVYSAHGDEIWNYTPQPANYILASPAVADSYLLIASNNGYLYALSDNSTLPGIGSIQEENAYVGKNIKIMIETPQQYQALLYYRNVSGDKYHIVWMNYVDGKYVGYIPAQNEEGNVQYYITLMNSTGATMSTEIRTIPVSQEIPELGYYPMVIFLLMLIIYMLRGRAHR